MAGLRFGSVCSGIEAASVAWEPLGWTPAWFAETAPFPNAVLAHHWPSVPNLGDITSHDFTARAKGQSPIDLLVGGTPCQGFSNAGPRDGLLDPRSALAVRFLAIARDLRPAWVVWENVHGCLTAGGGRDFGAFVGQVAQLGYRWAYRTLDAQFFGLPQRRRRVFLVGHLGAGRPEQVLLEPQGEGRRRAAGRPAGADDPRTAAVGPLPLAVGYNVQATYSEGRGPHAALCEVTKCLDSHGLNPDCQQGGTLVLATTPDGPIVRRLTPRECERLQGFPDDHTLVTYRRKPAADGPRYKALGNSIAVPVLRWIGRRLAVEHERLVGG